LKQVRLAAVMPHLIYKLPTSSGYASGFDTHKILGNLEGNMKMVNATKLFAEKPSSRYNHAG
jgi:hypothetical protein